MRITDCSIPLFLLFVFAAFLSPKELQAAENSATLINVSSTVPSPFLTALQSQGLTAISGDPSTTSFPGSLVVWESKGTIPDTTLAALGAFVQKGGSLLIGLDRKPGLGAMQLSFLSPTMGWETQRKGEADGTIETGWADPEIFGDKTNLKGLMIPYFFPIRPFHAVERGAERYFKFKSINYFVNTPHEPGDFFWTRPLLNREWTVRLRGSDRAATPLLLTGRYGAGRVAIFASGLTELPAASLLTPLLKWLVVSLPRLSKEPAVGAVQILSIQPVSLPSPTSQSLRVELKNTTGVTLWVQLLARILTWEGAPVGDTGKPHQIPANGVSTIDLSMPDPGPVQYQALDWRHELIARIGVLSSSGATLLAEKSNSVDFTPPVSFELYSDNLYDTTYPYPNAPGIYELSSMWNRMGAPVSAYAYPCGKTVNASVVLTNGIHNLASLATVTDETKPNNDSAMALNAGVGRMEKAPRNGTVCYGTWVGTAKTENDVLFHFPSPVTVAGVTLLGNDYDFRNLRKHNPGAVVIECDGKEVFEAPDMDKRFRAEDGYVHLMFTPVTVTDLRIRMPWVEKVDDRNGRFAPILGSSEILGSLTPLPAEATQTVSLVLRDAMSGAETNVAQKSISVPPGGRVVWTQAVQLPVNAGFYQLEARSDSEKRDIPILSIHPQRTLLSRQHLPPAEATLTNFDNTAGMERESVPLTTGRQMVQLACNPSLKLSMNFVWGWDSAVLGTAECFAQVVGTTEASRRHYYDGAWRGRIDEDGMYCSGLTYGYWANGDVSYVMSANDWQQMWRAQERFSLIYPDAPLGAGFVLGSPPASGKDAELGRDSGLFEKLHDAGLSLPFCSEILSLRKWEGNAPLIIPDASSITDDEAGILKVLAARGVRIASFAGTGPLSVATADLFGVTPDDHPAQAKPTGDLAGKAILENGNFLYLPCTADGTNLPAIEELAPLLEHWLAIPITFPEGTMGYGFISAGQKFIVLEDWMEKGRVAALRVHATGATARAIGLNEHQPLALKRDGADWVIQVPLRPGDGEVVVLEENKQ